MNNILISLSLGLNLLLTTIVVYCFTNIPYSLDAIRDTYLHDVKWAYDRGCLQGTDYPPEYRADTTMYNENSTVNWCAKMNQDMEEMYMQGAFHLGRAK